MTLSPTLDAESTLNKQTKKSKYMLKILFSSLNEGARQMSPLAERRQGDAAVEGHTVTTPSATGYTSGTRKLMSTRGQNHLLHGGQ